MVAAEQQLRERRRWRLGELRRERWDGGGERKQLCCCREGWRCLVVVVVAAAEDREEDSIFNLNIINLGG